MEQGQESGQGIGAEVRRPPPPTPSLKCRPGRNCKPNPSSLAFSRGIVGASCFYNQHVCLRGHGAFPAVSLGACAWEESREALTENPPCISHTHTHTHACVHIHTHITDTILFPFRRFEDYVDQRYKEHLKNQGKVDSVSMSAKTILLIPDTPSKAL